MSIANRIIMTEARSFREEGIIAAGETPKPGTIMQRQYATALQGNRWTWEIYNNTADGIRPIGPAIILCEDLLAGTTMEDAYVAGARAVGAIMLPGCEFHGILANITGTGDDHAKGEMLMVDDTMGKFIVTASSGAGFPESEPAVLNETVTDPTADSLRWMTWTGY